MKKILFTMLAATTMLFSSCSKEIAEEPQSGASTFSIEIPGEQSRATTDALTRYKVEAYEAKNLSSTPITAESSTGSLTLTLKKNTEYTFLFWADGGADKYTATSLQDIKPATPTAAGTRAFCLKTEFNSKDFEANKNVVLKSAVAQLNFVETSAKLTASNNTIKVTYADLGSLNVASGVITPNTTATPVARTFATTATTGTLATDYILADRNGAVSDLKVQFNSEPEKSVTAVTFKANYRTNLKGEFSNMYNSTFTVSNQVDDFVDQDFPIKEKSDIWDGVYPQWNGAAKYNGGKGTKEDPYQIYGAEDLAQLAVNTFHNNTQYFRLERDLNLDNHLWKPFLLKANFDGNGHKIINLNVHVSSTGTAAFISSMYGVTLCNLHVSGSVVNEDTEGRGTAGICVNCEDEGNVISGCSFSGTVTGRISAGVFGYNIAPATSTIQIIGCRNYATVTSPENYSSTGGILWQHSEGDLLVGCVNEGKVTGGGIIGGYSWGAVTGCYNLVESNLPIYNRLDKSASANNCYSVAKAGVEAQAGVTYFSATAWPASTGEWTVATTAPGTTNQYWKSLGGWNGGSPTYPKLWWE